MGWTSRGSAPWPHVVTTLNVLKVSCPTDGIRMHSFALSVQVALLRAAVGVISNLALQPSARKVHSVG
jgi:hypothetical protein